MFKSTHWLLPFARLASALIGASWAVNTWAQVTIYEGVIRNQTVQESAKARLKLKFAGERVTGYLTTYPPLQGSGPITGVRKQGKCVLSVPIDEDAIMELKGACRDEGFDGGYVVTFEGNYRPQRGNFLLTSVNPAIQAATEQGSGVRHPGENAPPIGDYGVYQHTGTTGYDFLYRLRFLNETEYMAYNSTKGTYTYEPKSRQFTFQSGPLAGYLGTYLTQEKGGVGRPKILLRSRVAPASSDPATLLREYLYAFYRPEGIQ